MTAGAELRSALKTPVGRLTIGRLAFGRLADRELLQLIAREGAPAERAAAIVVLNTLARLGKPDLEDELAARRAARSRS